MPPHDLHDHHQHRPHGGASPQSLAPKSNPKVLSMILKAIIMTAITTLFFLFLGVAAILLLLATAAFHRHSGPSDSAVGLSPKGLKKLPQFKFSRRTKPEDEADCVVCLEGIRQGQWCRKLIACGHVFHRKCIDAWLIKVSACPVCRTRVWLDSGTLPADRPLWGFGWTSESRVW
uniref:RING-H2 zinc finger protein n=1 Tax=Manihot esculenta TaxID=3983 RepID=H8ZJ02_MANES|nr:RING-H2 zinc finger protein [Manihot esculenta]